MPVSQTQNGTSIGFYAENSHRVIPITDCLINAVWTKDIISAFTKYIEEFSILGYDENTNSGELREITVKEIKGNLLITAVILKDNIRGLDRLVEIIKEYVKYPFSLYVNINKLGTNVIYGETFKLIYGKPDYTSEMFGIKYKIGVQSFMQVNDSVCAKLYSTVRTLINSDENTVVFDAYSGAGLMTAILAKNAKKAIGVEIIPEAVACANDLAKMNNLDSKIENHLGKCEDILPTLIEKEKQNNSNVSVVLDPPRKGCDIKVINAILKSDIDKIVYVSCKPSTLARDVGLLVGSLKQDGNAIVKAENYTPKYEITYARPFDMFAHTKHVETLVCLSKKTEKHINIDIEFGEGEGQVSLKKLQEELNGQKPKKKTTYKDIQAYVEEKYGFKVHTAYIAEVKRDLGLPMYDAPNAVEELKRPRSHPTAEMIEAIKDALKHFEII